MNPTLRIATLAALLATLAGCGNKGPLVLPARPAPIDPATVPAAQPATDAQPATQDPAPTTGEEPTTVPPPAAEPPPADGTPEIPATPDGEGPVEPPPAAPTDDGDGSH